MTAATCVPRTAPPSALPINYLGERWAFTTQLSAGQETQDDAKRGATSGNRWLSNFSVIEKFPIVALPDLSLNDISIVALPDLSPNDI